MTDFVDFDLDAIDTLLGQAAQWLEDNSGAATTIQYSIIDLQASLTWIRLKAQKAQGPLARLPLDKRQNLSDLLYGEEHEGLERR